MPADLIVHIAGITKNFPCNLSWYFVQIPANADVSLLDAVLATAYNAQWEGLSRWLCMNDLKLQLLGEFRVSRGATEIELPPSKKTRALLAYLAVNARKFSREHLCELLWEVPDDPRGSLRWSLSKIRRLVDTDDNPRVIASRSHIRLDVTGIEIDSQYLQSLVNSNLNQASTEDLILAANQFEGQFLEGLEMARFHSYSSWCIAEREQVSRAQIALLKELIARLDNDSESCLQFARKLVLLSPYDGAVRVKMLELLARCGRDQEAEQQYEQGRRLLQEVGEDPAALHLAWRNIRNGTIVKSQPQSTAQPDPLSSTALIPPEPATQDIAKQARSVQTLVGRDREIARLTDSFQQVVEKGKVACLLFDGEPGIGKSSLLQMAENLARQRQACVLSAAAFESEIVRPFGLWNDALRESSFANLSDMLSGEERIDRDRLFSSISHAVSQQADKRAVVLIFDDIQWCDESSAAALHYVLRMNVNKPVWAVFAARDDELKLNFPLLSALRGLRQEQLLQTEHLKPLSREALETLIVKEAPTADRREISEKSRGNPLLAIELARAVAAGNMIGTLNELIGERIARMQDSTVAMLHWAAVLAPYISIGGLLRYTGLDDNGLEQALEEAEKSGFLFPDESGFKFSHNLVTGSIYRSISPTRRRSMHRRIAEMLEADTALDLKLATELARHAAQSGDPLLAARAMLQAGRLCLRFYANDDAFQLAQRGMVFVTELPATERICLTLELKEVQLMAAPVEDWEATVSDFITLAENALDHGALESARLGYQMASSVRWTHGQWSGAKKSIMQAERVSRGGSEEGHIIGMAEAARCLLMLEKDLSDADALLMEASSRAARFRLHSDALAAALGMLRYYENKLDEAEELMDEARTRAKVLGDRMNEFQANEYLSMIAIEKEDFVAAKSRSESLAQIGEKLRQGSEEPFARALIGICEYACSQQEVSIDDALQSLRGLDAKQRLTYALNRAALLDLRFEKWDSATVRANEALKNAEIMERISEIIIARVILADAARSRADETTFQLHLKFLLDLPQDAGAKWARAHASRLISHYQESTDGITRTTGTQLQSPH